MPVGIIPLCPGVGQIAQFYSGDSDAGALGQTYAWNFGDSGTSTSPNPTHTYAGTGFYTVTLTRTSPASVFSFDIGVVAGVVNSRRAYMEAKEPVISEL